MSRFVKKKKKRKRQQRKKNGVLKSRLGFTRVADVTIMYAIVFCALVYSLSDKDEGCFCDDFEKLRLSEDSAKGKWGSK